MRLRPIPITEYVLFVVDSSGKVLDRIRVNGLSLKDAQRQARWHLRGLTYTLNALEGPNNLREVSRGSRRK